MGHPEESQAPPILPGGGPLRSKVDPASGQSTDLDEPALVSWVMRGLGDSTQWDAEPQNTVLFSLSPISSTARSDPRN